MKCQACGEEAEQTPPVNIVLLILPNVAKPFRLLPSEDYRLCDGEGCPSVIEFIKRAIASHREASSVIGDNWWRARIVFDDGFGWCIENGRYKQVARA